MMLAPSILPFENFVNGKKSSEWFLENRSLILYSSVVYMLIVYVCKSYMKNQRPVNLRRPLLIWNTSLAVFSMIGVTRMIPAIIQVLQKTGSEGSLCRNLHSIVPQSAIFWIWLFVTSKVFQLNDGLFSVFRKKEYASFYCYYRMGMMLLASYTYGLHPSEIMWYAVADYLVNTFVYGTYAMKAFGLRTPRTLLTALITMQIFRAVLDFSITMRAIDSQLAGSKCDLSIGCAFLNLGLLFSFILIFCGYFYDVWFVHNRKDRNTSVAIFLNLVDKFILFLKTFNTLYQGEEDDELM